MKLSRRNLLQGTGAGLALTALNTISAPVKSSGSLSVSPSLKDNDQKIDIISLDRLEQQAKKVMTPGAYAFIADAAGDEWTLRENRRAFNDFPIIPHHLQNIATKDINLNISLLGHKLPFPIVAAPAGAHTFVNPEGEVVTASGVGAAGTLYQSSGASARPLEAIAKATQGPKWFQLYFNVDLGVTRDLLLRARAAGYSAIIITADAIGPGTSDAFISLGKPFPPNFTFGNYDPRFGGRGDFSNQKVNITPEDIDFVRSVSNLPVIIKGIIRAEDADIAIKSGASAIQVSNHGGRQLDGIPATLSILQDVVKSVQGRVPIIFDSGIRRGIDVFRALALGADAVAIGRPMLYGLAVGGAKGVQSVFEHLRDELNIAMLLAGAKSVHDLSPDYLSELKKRLKE